MPSISLRSRDKFAIVSALGILSMVSWLSTLYQAQMTDANHAHAHMTGIGPDFSSLALLLYLFTWTVMMTAMMLPSTGPMIMTYAAVSTQGRSIRTAHVSTGLFVLGYLLAWSGTGVIAYVVSVVLPMASHGMNEAARYSVAGAVLIVAGAYQFSSLKNLCLSYCRTPLGYIMTHWREGRGGAARMGWQHGLYCIGCCWALMAILFVVGVMNLAGMALLALIMFVEKASRHGVLLSRTVGLVLFTVGTLLIFYGLL